MSLNATETRALEASTELARAMRALIGEGPCAESDWAEVAGRIHDIQARIMWSVVAREHPDAVRAPGGGA